MKIAELDAAAQRIAAMTELLECDYRCATADECGRCFRSKA